MNREHAVRRALTTELGHDPGTLDWQPLSGGDINQAARVRCASGEWFVKWNDHGLAGQFTAEAAALQALHATHSGLRIPRVVAARDTPAAEAFLLLEYLAPGRRADDFDTALGVGLARLHQASSERGYGFAVDGYCGTTPQPNGWADDWARFYAERRLGWQLQLAAQNGLDTPTLAAGERLLARLHELLGDPEPPALIHGDLWSGNLHVCADGGPGLIDPAAYFGHREAELGMMVMFGGFGAEVFAAYEGVRALQPGWRERLPLYTLYHVLNHFNLFGGAYAEQAARIIRRHA